MRMQEPEQQPIEQEWQASQEFSGYRAENPATFESEQQQKVYPQEEQNVRAKAAWIIAIVFSSIGFFLTVAGIVASAIVLKYAGGLEALLVGGIIGLLSAIGAMLVCVGIFVIAVVVLAGRSGRRRRWMLVRV